MLRCRKTLLKSTKGNNKITSISGTAEQGGGRARDTHKIFKIIKSW